MPFSSSSPRLGDLERVVMEHLWESTAEHPDGATVRDVLGRFAGEREIAYTTVMTVLDRLAKKNLVTRERDGRAWRYRPAGTREALTAATMRRTLDDMDVVDRRAALLHFLDGATAEEIEDLKSALAQLEARGHSHAESSGAAGSSAPGDALGEGARRTSRFPRLRR